MIQMATQVIVKNPKVAECSAASLIGAVMQASILGFKPSDSLGQVYFVPYGKSVQFQVGYKGYIDLARRSGQIKTLYAYPVYQNDHFEYELGLEPKLTHRPAQEDRGEMTFVYAVAHYKDGGYNFVVLSRNEVERLRLRNAFQKSKPSGAWATDYEAMACAKAIKQLSKYMPLSEEMQGAVLSDEGVIQPDNFSNDQTGSLDADGIYPEADEIDVEVMEDVDTETGELFSNDQQ
jgi:recombination protein RecT